MLSKRGNLRRGLHRWVWLGLFCFVTSIQAANAFGEHNEAPPPAQGDEEGLFSQLKPYFESLDWLEAALPDTAQLEQLEKLLGYFQGPEIDDAINGLRVYAEGMDELQWSRVLKAAKAQGAALYAIARDPRREEFPGSDWRKLQVG